MNTIGFNILVSSRSNSFPLPFPFFSYGPLYPAMLRWIGAKSVRFQTTGFRMKMARVYTVQYSTAQVEQYVQK